MNLITTTTALIRNLIIDVAIAGPSLLKNIFILSLIVSIIKLGLRELITPMFILQLDILKDNLSITSLKKMISMSKSHIIQSKG